MRYIDSATTALLTLCVVTSSLPECVASTLTCNPAIISATQHPTSKFGLRLHIADDPATERTLFPATVTLCLVATSDITNSPTATFTSSSPSTLPTAQPTTRAVTPQPTFRPSNRPTFSPTETVLGCPNTDLNHVNCASDWQAANPGQKITQRQCYDLGCCFDPRNGIRCFPRLVTNPTSAPTTTSVNVSSAFDAAESRWFSAIWDEEEDDDVGELDEGGVDEEPDERHDAHSPRMLSDTGLWEFANVGCSSMRNVTSDSNLDVIISTTIPADSYSIVINIGATCLPTGFQTEVVDFTQCDSYNTVYPVIVPADTCVAQFKDHCVDRERMSDSCPICAISDACAPGSARFHLGNETICVLDSPACTSSALSSGAVMDSSNTSTVGLPVEPLAECVSGDLWAFPSVGMIDPTCMAPCVAGFEFNSTTNLCVPSAIDCLDGYRFNFADSCIVDLDVPLVADAGPDLELGFGAISDLTLIGSVSSGVGVITYEWTLVSQTFDSNAVPTAHSPATITTPNQATTGVLNLSPGTLTFRLSVSNDEGKSDDDTVQVTVLKLDDSVSPGGVGAVGVGVSFDTSTTALVLGSIAIFDITVQGSAASELASLADTLSFRVIAADDSSRTSSLTASATSQHALEVEFGSSLRFEGHSQLAWTVPLDLDVAAEYSLHVVLESSTRGTLGRVAQSLPLTVVDPFELSLSAWSECSSATWQCGSGSQQRSATCAKTDITPPDMTVALSVCATRGLAIPELDKDCWSGPCNGKSGSDSFELGEWSTCSQTCGGGVQTRNVQCVANVDEDESTLTACPMNSLLGQLITTPPVVRSCNQHACASTQYYVDSYTHVDDGDQQACVCAASGYDLPSQYCRDDTSMLPMSIDHCSGTQPARLQHEVFNCSQARCPTSSHAWRVGTWSECNMLACGSDSDAGPVRTRAVECVNIATGVVETDDNTIAAMCQGTPPASSAPCPIQTCSRFVWGVGSWGECEGERCGPDSIRKRPINCMEYALTRNGERVTQVNPSAIVELEWRLVNETDVAEGDTSSNCSEALKPDMYESCAHMPCPPCALVSNAAGSVPEGVSCTDSRTFDVVFVPTDANLTSTCTSMVVDRSGACCAGNWPRVGAAGECCASGVLDACGVCNGNATVVDIFGECCQHVDAAGKCCAGGPPDSCGVCQGQGLTCPLHVSLSGAPPDAKVAGASWADAFVFGNAWVHTLIEDSVLVGLGIDVTLTPSEYDSLFGAPVATRRLQTSVHDSKSQRTQLSHSLNSPAHRQLQNDDLQVILRPLNASSGVTRAGQWDAGVLDQVVARVVESPSLSLVSRSGTCGNGVCEVGESCVESASTGTLDTTGGGSACCPQDCPFLRGSCPGMLADGVTACSGHGRCSAYSGMCTCYQGQGYKGVGCDECKYGWVASEQHAGVCVVAEEKVTWIKRQSAGGGGDVWKGLWAEQWPVIVATIVGIVALLLCILLTLKFSIISGAIGSFQRLARIIKQREQGGRVAVLGGGKGAGMGPARNVKLQSARVMASSAVVPELTTTGWNGSGANAGNGAGNEGGERMRADGAMVELEGWLKIRPMSSLIFGKPANNVDDSDTSDDEGVVWERYYFVLFKRDKELTYFQAVSDVGDGAKVYIGEMGAVALNNLCFVRSLRNGGFKRRTFQIGTFMEIQERSFDANNVTSQGNNGGGAHESSGYKHRASTQVKIVAHELLARTPQEKQRWVDALSFYVEAPQLKVLNGREMDLPHTHHGDRRRTKSGEGSADEDDDELLPLSELRRGSRVA